MGGRLFSGFVRRGAFIGKEVIDVRRQPRLLISLVLGPFLILFLFGVGYSAEQQDIRTVVVFPEDMQVDLNVATYKDAFAPPFVLVGVTKDKNGALAELALRQVQVVVLFPPQAYSTIASGQRATLQVLYNEINPLQSQWLQYYSYVQTNELNKRILMEALKNADKSRAGQDATAGAMKTVAQTMGNDSRALRNDITANNPKSALDQVAKVRAANQAIQRNLLSSAQVLGGVALFVGARDPLQTPQAQAIASAQGAVNTIDTNLTQLETDFRGGKVQPADAGLAQQVEEQSALLITASDQLKIIPPEVVVAPFQSKSTNVSAINPGVVEFYAPAVIALLVQHIAVTLTALTLVRERLLGTVELFRVAPISAGEIVTGKYISYFLLTAVLTALLAAAMRFGLGAPILSGYGPFALVLALLILASLSFGFLISALSNTESQAVQLSMLILLASVFFGGFFLGLESLLPFVRVVSYALPVTYGIQALQAVMLRGEPAPQVALYALGGMAAALLVVSSSIFRAQFRRR